MAIQTAFEAIKYNSTGGVYWYMEWTVFSSIRWAFGKPSDKTIQCLFGNPETLEDYANEALKIVPPIGIATKVIIYPSKRGTIQITFQNDSDAFTQEQVNMHLSVVSMMESQALNTLDRSESSDTSLVIDPTIWNQENEMEQQLKVATNNINSVIPQLNQLEN